MMQVHINRSTETPKGSLIVFVKAFESIQDALDELYRQAKRHGYEVTIDNSTPASLGFCLWQIQVVVGKWRYYATVEDETSLGLFGF